MGYWVNRLRAGARAATRGQEPGIVGMTEEKDSHGFRIIRTGIRL